MSRPDRWSKKILVSLAFLLLVDIACDRELGSVISEDDMLGSWLGITANGRAGFNFGRESGLNTYTLIALDGDFGSIILLAGSDIITAGQWSLQTNVLTLYDDDGLPLSCPLVDRYEILMSDSKETFALLQVGDAVDGCLTKTQVLESSGWSRQPNADPS